MPGLTQGIRRALLLRPEGSAVIDGTRSFTWNRFADRVARLAGAFQSHRLTPGGRVVLLALNSHHSLECFYAAMWAGGVIVPLNHRLSQDELGAQVASSVAFYRLCGILANASRRGDCSRLAKELE